MKQPEKIPTLFEKYRTIVDADIKKLFVDRKEDMYGVMQYFLGYTDEKFFPTNVYAGKRFRSGLCLFVADMYNKIDIARPIASAIEIFHNFTLIHDDIVDKDELRRGRPTVWKLWGVDYAINSGDAQLLLVNIALADYMQKYPQKGAEVFFFLSEQFLLVTEGQHLDFEMSAQYINEPYVTKKRYFDMVSKKTSVLVGASTKAAGMVCGCDEKEIQMLWNFGYHLGIAYQLSDDFMSIWGETKVTGKVVHKDLKEKKKTFPVLYAYEKLDSGDKKTLDDLYRKEDSLEPEDITQIIDLFEKVGSREFVQREVVLHAEKAKNAATVLTLKKEDKEMLISIVDAILPAIEK